MDVGTFFFILVIVIVVIAVLLMAGASWLQRTAVSNQARQEQLVHQRETLRSDIATAREALAGFEGIQTARFQKLYVEATEQTLPQIVRTTQEMDMVSTASGVEVPQGMVAALSQLLQKPGEARDVSRSAQALNDNESKLADGRKQMTALQQTIDQLSAMRSLMQEEAIRLQGRLEELGDDLAGEQAAGITGLDEWVPHQQGFLAEVTALRAKIESDKTFDVIELDEIGQSLEGVTRAANELAEDVKEKRQARVAFDALLEEADGKMQSVGGSLAEAGDGEAAAPLLAHLGAFLGEARVARQAADFTTATSRVEASRPLQGLLETAVTISEPVAELDKVKPLSLQSETIEGVQGRLAETWDQMGESLGLHGEETFPADELAERTAAFEQQLQEVKQAALAVKEAHENDVRRLTQEANAATAVLKEAWSNLQGNLPLGDEEPLTERYNEQLEAEADATGLPLGLQAYAETAQALTGDIQETTRNWTIKLSALDSLIETLPPLDKAEEMAAGWTSLQPFAAHLQELAAGAKSSREAAVSSPTLAAAYAAVEQASAQVAEATTTYETLSVRWGQMDYRKAIVEMILHKLQPVPVVENGEAIPPNPVAEKVTAAAESNDVNEAIGLLKTAVSEAEALLEQ